MTKQAPHDLENEYISGDLQVQLGYCPSRLRSPEQWGTSHSCAKDENSAYQPRSEIRDAQKDVSPERSRGSGSSRLQLSALMLGQLITDGYEKATWSGDFTPRNMDRLVQSACSTCNGILLGITCMIL